MLIAYLLFALSGLLLIGSFHIVKKHDTWNVLAILWLGAGTTLTAIEIIATS